LYTTICILPKNVGQKIAPNSTVNATHNLTKAGADTTPASLTAAKGWTE
jgi:hypothetical protein